MKIRRMHKILASVLVLLLLFCGTGTATFALENDDAPPDVSGVLPSDVPGEPLTVEETVSEDEQPALPPLPTAPENEEPANAPPPEPPPAENENVINPCGDLETLRALLEDGAVDHITLTADILADEPWMSLEPEPERLVTVEMGDFTIFVQGQLSLSNNLRFVGNGSEQPLFQVTTGSLSFGTVEIVARSDNATAIYVQNLGEMGYASSGRSTIIANGKNATAVHAEYAKSIYNLNVSALGEDGVGLRLDNSSETLVYSCHIEAGKAAIVSDGQLVFAQSTVRPEMPEAVEAEVAALWCALYDFVPYNILQYGLWVMEGETLDFPDVLDIYIQLWQGHSSTILDLMQIPIDWDYDPAIFDSPGEYTIGATPRLPLPDMVLPNLEHGKRQEIPFYVLEKGKQYLTFAYEEIVFPPESNCIGLNLFLDLDEDASYRLWHREGDNEWGDIEAGDWQDLISGKRCFYYDGFGKTIYVSGLDFSEDNAFRLQITDDSGDRMTNVLYFPTGISFALGGHGGDRDGTGQDDQGEDPPPGGDPLLVSPPEDSQPPVEDPPDTPGDGGDGSAPPYTTPPGHSGPGTGTAPVIIEYADPAAPPQPDSGGSGQGAVPTQKTTLNADGLDALRKTQPHEMTFIADGIKLVIPTALLEGLVLGEGEVFTVELGAEGARFTVRLFAGAREIAGFSGHAFSVYVSYQTQAALSALYCEGADGARIPAQSYADGVLLFWLTATGDYEIHEEPAAAGTPEGTAGGGAALPQTEQPPKQSALPWTMAVIAGCSVLGAGAAIAARRGKMRKNRG